MSLLAVALLTGSSWTLGTLALSCMPAPELRTYERVALQLTAGLGLSALVLSLAALTAGSPMHAAILVATLVLILKGGRLGRRTRSHSE